ncbi:LOW QUALITY PROTEIN: cytochrome P450 11B, mitochondrial-like [Passer domesticus]|uniref:LOW QUALITY PROTEIN: cytochrome P450 11B, mitochondrial-like n=1 Tax=Passer domesticus TaxID=48849 RepID=UPI0030FED30E
MGAPGWLWGRGARRALSSGGSPIPGGSPSSGGSPISGVAPGSGVAPRPFEEMPRAGRGRWLNLLSLWGRGGFQDFHRRMEGGFQRLGPVYRDRVGSLDCVNVLLPRDAAQLLRAEGPFPRRMGIAAWSAHRSLRAHRCGLFLLNGPEWRADRLALNRAVLSPAGARRLLPLLDAVARDFAESLGGRVRGTPGGALTIDPHPLLFRFTLEASSYALYGERLGLLGGSLSGGAQRFLGALEEMLRTTLPLLFLPPPLLRLHPPLWQRHLRAWDAIFQHADASIQRLYREFCRGGVPGGGVLAELLLQGQLPLPSIKANVTEFTAGGVDTTAIPLLFTLFELGRNPGVQRELREELRAAGGGPRDPRGWGGATLPELLGALPLLKAAIKETLRLYPVGITVQRYPATDVVLHNYRVPAGTLCQVALYAMGRCPDVFPHPERYDPRRWLGKDDTTFKALAFGFGARQCIGRRLAEAEMMLFLAHVLSNFSIEAVSSEDVPTVFRFILMPERSPLLTFRALE